MNFCMIMGIISGFIRSKLPNILRFLLICATISIIYQKKTEKTSSVIDLSNVTPLISNSTECRWPPIFRNSSVYSNVAYNITICLQFNPDVAEHDRPKFYRLSDLFNGSSPNEVVTFEDLAHLPRSMYKHAKYPHIFSTYPQDVPIKAIVQQIKKGSPVSYRPKYNFPINILRTSNSVCSKNTKHDFIIVVKSAVYNVNERQEFRKFMEKQRARYPQIQAGLVFSVGIPRIAGSRFFNRDGHTLSLPGSSGEKLKKYNGKADILLKRVLSESEKYDDILLGDYVDTYYNNSWKTVTNLRWVSAFCNKKDNDFFMFIDDDFRVNLSRLEEFRNVNPLWEIRSSIWGKIVTDGIGRSPTSKWFLSYREIPYTVTAPYTVGMSQIYGADVVDDMAIGSAYTKHNYMHDDVYLGLLARKLDIPLKALPNMYSGRDYEGNKRPRLPPLVTLKEEFY